MVLNHKEHKTIGGGGEEVEEGMEIGEEAIGVEEGEEAMETSAGGASNKRKR